MILLVLFVVTVFLWFLALLPMAAPYSYGRPWLAWISVVLLGLYIFAPAFRG